jgi:hypothetical protein
MRVNLDTLSNTLNFLVKNFNYVLVDCYKALKIEIF